MRSIPIITSHAKEQFETRLKNAYPGCKKDPDRLLNKLLHQAYPTSINPTSLVNRTLKHGYPVIYFRTDDGWRFVIKEEDDGTCKLITVERICKGEN